MDEITVTGGNSTGGELLENSSETFWHASETFYPTLDESTYVKSITNRDWRINVRHPTNSPKLSLLNYRY